MKRTFFATVFSIGMILPAFLGAATEEAAAVEARFTRFLQSRNPAPTANIAVVIAPQTEAAPTSGELMAIARNWQSLSASFKSLYRSAVSFTTDSSDTFFISPGSHFEIHYDKSVLNNVARMNTADAYGYDPTDWHTKIETPNDRPDFLDEVAFAFDSAWAMEIERFGFLKPISSPSDISHSQPMRVRVMQLPQNIYAYTQWDNVIEDASQPGSACWFEVRENYRGFVGDDFENHPERILGVTAVHEFFHSIQYAATWMAQDVFFDDIPLTFIEGSATSMEEQGFPDNDDWHQYAAAFFSAPRNQIFSQSYYGTDVYKNVLPCLWLQKHADTTPSNKWLQTVFTKNAETKGFPFQDLLEIASSTCGTKWSSLLNNFYTASYYTGSRADTTRFISDAPGLSAWALTVTANQTDTLTSLPVSPLGMNWWFDTLTGRARDSTLPLSFRIETMPNSLPTSLWLFRPGSQTPDSSIQIQIQSGTTFSIVPDTTRFNRMAIISVNPSCTQSASLSVIQPRPPADTLSPIDTAYPRLIYPRPFLLSRHKSIIIQGYDLESFVIRNQSGAIVRAAPQDDKEFIVSTDKAVWSPPYGSLLPGVYFVMIHSKNGSTALERILVLP